MGIAKGEGVKGTIRARTFGGKVKVIGPSVSVKKLEKSINTKIADKLIVSWDMMFGLLVRYKNEFSHTHIGHRENYEKTTLGSWLSNQRGKYKRGELNSVRVKRLEELGVEWNVREMYWERNYMIMQKVVLDTGRPYLKRGTVIDGEKIAQWCELNRLRRKEHLDKAKKDPKYKNSEAFKEREKKNRRLENLCPGKWWWDPETEKFDEQLSVIEQQLKDFPGQPIPADLKLVDTTFGGFRKHIYKYKKVDHSKWKKMQKIAGFEEAIESASREANFLKKIKPLEEYRDKKGDYNVPKSNEILYKLNNELKKSLYENHVRPYIIITLTRLQYLKRYIAENSDKPFSHYERKFSNK